MKTNLIPMVAAAVLALGGAAARGEATLSLVDAADRATAVVDPATGGVVAVRARIDAADGPVAGFDAEIALPSPLEVVEVGGTSAALGGAEVLAATNGLRANCISLDGGEPVSPTTGAALLSFTVRVPAGTPEGRYEVGLGPRCGIYADGTSNTCAVAVAPLGVVVAATDPVRYLDPVGGTNATCSSYTPYFGGDTLDAGWWVVSGAVTNANRITVSGDVNLILKDGAELYATNGIDVAVVGSVTNSLAIWAQCDAAMEGSNAGKLYAGPALLLLDEGFAGIGGGNECAGGEISINGGMVVAYGGKDAAGIGGGYGASGNVTISGGMVTARGYRGAGIGGGGGGSGGNVTIIGGMVTADGAYGAGIGGGMRGDGGDVVISGGTVAASSILGQAIGHGEDANDSGDLSFDGMKVFASQADMDAIPDRPVAADLRETFCRTNWVALAVCDPHDYDGDACRRCGAENPLQPIAASVTGWTGPYDGQGHGVDVAVTAPSDETPALRFTLDDPSYPDTVWSESAPMFTNVCDETVWVELSAEGYRTTTISAAVTVVPAPLAITAKDQTYAYNGQPQGEGDPVYVDPADIAAKVEVEGLAAGDALASVVLSGHQTDPGVYTNWIAPSSATVTNAAGGSVTANYDIAYTNGTLTIEEPPPPVVSNVVARQRWPWNGLVDVDYEISGYTAGLKAEIVFEEQGGTNRWTATKFFADVEPTLNPGLNRATWDSKAEGATDLVATVVATMRLVREE